MATLDITFATTDGNAGAHFRKLAKQIEKAASIVPDLNPTGASYVLTIDNTDPSVQIRLGPTTGSKLWF